MSSLQPPEPSSTQRRSTRQDDQVRVAPYLTHVVAHHGQLTLIPPQNAGRIRKPTKKKKQSANRNPLDDEEPRFTTAVPLSSSRKLHPAPAHVRTRKHAISTSSPASASPTAASSPPPRFDPIIDDQAIPDYPPPSFEDAIAAPYVPPHLSSSGTSDSRQSPLESHDDDTVSIDSSARSQYEHPVTSSSSIPSISVPTSVASVTPSTIYASHAAVSQLEDSPAASQVSLVRSVDLHPPHDSPRGRSRRPGSSPLLSPSTTTLLSVATPVSTTTALSYATAALEPSTDFSASDTPLLRPPQRRYIPQSSLAEHSPEQSPLVQASPGEPALRPRERSPQAVPYRLTSPSPTTLLSAHYAVRDSPASEASPALSDISLPLPRPRPQHSHYSLPALRSEHFEHLPSSVQHRVAAEPVLSAEDSVPSSPSSPVRTSIATTTDVFEEFTWEPRQRWSADRRLGLSLEERVQREFQRRNTEEVLTAFGGGSGASANTRKCLHCGTIRSLECGDIESIDEASEEDEDSFEEEREREDDEDSVHAHSYRRSPLPPVEKGKSPYLDPSSAKGKGMSRSKSLLMRSPKGHSPEPASPPGSPLSPSASGFFKLPMALASSMTLSFTNALGKDKDSMSDKSFSTQAYSNKSLKRRESFGVKRLFGGLKGKEKEHSRSQSAPSAALTSTVNLNPSFVSSSDSSSASESFDGWEVVSIETDSVDSMQSASTSNSPTAPRSPARSSPDTSAPSPTSSISSPTDSSRSAFLNRPMRHRLGPALLDSPTTPTSPLPALPHHAPAPCPVTTAVARPYPPEKSPLRMAATVQPRQPRLPTIPTPTIAHPMTAPSLHTPRAALAPLPASTAAPATAPAAPRTVKPSPSVIWKVPSPVSRSPLSRTPTSASPASTSPLSSPASAPHPLHPEQPAHPEILPHPKHPAIAALSRSEKNAHKHYSAPLPAIASMTVAMSLELAAQPPRRSPSPTPVLSSPSLASPVSPTTPTSPASPTSGHGDVQGHLRRRRAVTPPPSHRMAMLSCDTNVSAGAGAGHCVSPLALPDITIEGENEEEPEGAREPACIEQIMSAARATHGPRGGRMSPIPASPVTPTTPATPMSAASTPTTPTCPAPSATGPGTPGHYHGRPLPQLPAEHAEIAMPVKRVPDGYGYPVNRVPEVYAREAPPSAGAVPSAAVARAHASQPRPPPPPPPPRSPARLASYGRAPPPPPPPPLATTVAIVANAHAARAPPPSPVAAVSSPATLVSLSRADVVPPPPAFPLVVPPPPPLPASSMLTVLPSLLMERSTSGGSIWEDEVGVGPRQEFLEVTELDLLASRAIEGAEDGDNYDDLLQLSEILGPAARQNRERDGASPEKVPFTGKIEVTRRRVLKDGRVKLKLSLLGVAVDRCGICMSQFRRDERAALTPVCKHSFHEACLQKWLRESRVCPICRMALSMDN